MVLQFKIINRILTGFFEGTFLIVSIVIGGKLEMKNGDFFLFLEGVNDRRVGFNILGSF